MQGFAEGDLELLPPMTTPSFIYAHVITLFSLRQSIPEILNELKHRANPLLCLEEAERRLADHENCWSLSRLQKNVYDERWRQFKTLQEVDNWLLSSCENFSNFCCRLQDPTDTESEIIINAVEIILDFF